MKHITHFYSDRDLPLVYYSQGRSRDYDVLTIENYLKWYSLFIVHPTGLVEKVDWSDLDTYTPPGESPWCDHVPNPTSVAKLAQAKGWYMCDESMEMIIGRWERESRNRYEETYVDDP